MASQNYNVSLNINANAQSAEKQLQNLQKQLQQISNMRVNVGVDGLKEDIEEASQAAMKLSAHLAAAVNPQTGNLDFTKFHSSIERSGASLKEYGAALQKMGPAGQKAFVSLADSISKSEIPLKRTSKLVDGMWDNLKKTVGWQLSSSMVHGFIGSVQQAMGYAKDLNKSLTDIRIVTGQSADQMAQFARQANQAAKNLSTTTTDYTKASLIYYQQGLSEAEVKARTETTIKMANATGTTAQTVSDQMTAIWNNYDNGTKSLEHYADVMTALGAATASSTDEIAQGLQKFASISNTVGLSYEYAASALATITAESRESADVVGNALKTLFSRIQGLQLGETLEDGTTLNKYSTALAKVGISIKDQAGGLKDMDDILDEMGSKWGTLARDEKMALAQTVAGVRQYTQLMTLMENWDDFKKNLNVANTSTGTLDTQAAIHAESWEAASNRVRASWEGLWDNLIDSDSAIQVLDLISSFANMLDGITTGLGGAGGALSHFAAIFLKIFTPKIGENINNIGYGIKMMFGGRDKMKAAREEWLTSAKGALSGDSAFFDIGESQGKAYQDVLQQRINTSLAYSQHWDSMSAEERIYAQQVQARQEEIGKKYIAAGQQYDNSKNALGESYWNLYQLDDNNKAINPLDIRKNPLQYSDEQRLKSHQESLKKIQGKNSKSYQEQRAKHEAVIRELEGKQGLTYGERLKKQASAMLDFEKTIGSLGDDSIKNMAAFESSWAKLDEVISTTDKNKIPKGVKLFKEQMQALIEAGDIEGAKAYAVGSSKGLNDITARIFAEELGLDRDALISYMDNATNTELSKRNFEAYQQYQKRMEQEELKMQRKDPRNWGEGLTSAAEGAMATLSLIQQINALKDGSMSAGETVASLVTGVGSAGMAVTGFSQALKALGIASGATAGWIGVLITALGVLGSFAIDYISDIYNADKIAAQQAADTATTTASAYQEAEKYNSSLKTQIQQYKDNEEAIRGMTYGSTEKEQAIYDSNKLASSLISQENLKEDEDYYRVGNQIKIKDTALERIQQQAEDRVLESDAIAQMAQLSANQAATKSTGTDLRRDILKEVGAGDKAAIFAQGLYSAGNGLAVGGLGAAGAGAAGFGVGAIPGLIVAGVGTAIMGATSIWTNHINKYQGEMEKSLDYLTKNGAEILNKDIQEIVQEIGISEETAKLLQKNKTQLQNYSGKLTEQDAAYDLVTDNIARNIVAQNEVAQKSEYATKLADASGRVYQKRFKELEKEITTENAAELAQQYAELMGFDKYEQFKLGSVNEKDKTVSYSYFDAASGKTVDKEMSFSQISTGLASSEAKKFLENDWINNTITQLKELEKKTGGKGLSALLTGGDFDSSTVNELKDIQKIINNITGTTESEKLNNLIEKMFPGKTLAEVAEQFGYTEEQLRKLIFTAKNFNISGFQNTLENNGFTGFTDKNGNLNNNWNWMTVGNIQSLSREMNGLGTEAGKLFSDGLYKMISESGIDSSKWSTALTLLLNNINWSDWDALEQARVIIEGLGGTLNTGSQYWQEYANKMRDAQGSIPDFSVLIDQLSKILTLLNALKTGDFIEDEDYKLLMNYLGGEEGNKYKDLFKTDANGKKQFIGTEEEAEAMRQDAIKKGEDELAQGEKKVAEINAAKSDIEEGVKSTNKDTKYIATGLIDGDVTYSDVQVAAANGYGSQIKTMTGLSPDELNELNKDYLDAKQEQESAQAELDRANAALLETKKKFDANEASAEDVIAAEKAVAEAQSKVDQAQIKVDELQAKKDEIATKVEDIMKNGAEDTTQEQKEQLISAKYDTYSKFEEGKLSGDNLIVNDDGSYTTEGLKQLKSLAMSWEGGVEAVKAYNEAVASGNQVAIEAAEANMEIAAAIGEVAAARGLDAEQVAIQAEAIQSNFTGEINGVKIQGQLTAEAIADMAAEMIAASNAATKLKSKSKDLYKDINSKDAAAASSALAELEKDVIALIGAEGDAAKAGPSFRKYLRENQDVVEAAANGNEKALNKLRQAYVDSSIAEGGLLDDVALAAKNLGKTEDFNNIKSNIAGLGEAISSLQADGLWNVGEALTRGLGGVGDTLYSTIDGLMALGPAGQAAAQAIGDAFGFNVTHVDVSAESLAQQNYQGVVGVEGIGGAIDYKQGSEAQALIQQGGTVKIPVITPKAGGGSGKAGGGGGGGGKEPKKVAQTRRSQVVKRYKNVDAQRATNKNRRDNMSKKTDKLYGESRITNLQKENKLLEEGLRLNEKKAEEALKNLKIDEESLRKMTKKYGYELELDSEGNIKNYEQILGDIYDQLHKLEADGELSEEEEKIKEKLEIKKQEIEGAMEDWEDTLKQLEELNNEYEELIDEMHSNELEQITYKLEFELELNELDTEWYDFLNEQIGDDFTQAVDTMDLITEKIKIANDNINLYKQSVTDLMENIENDPNRSLITGYLEDGVLTDEEAETLKEAYSGIIEQLSALAEAKTSAEELLVSIFEGYKERIDFDTTALEHYTSLLEHFGNVVDIVGQKQLGLSDQFMENMAKMRIQQSRDIMSAAQSELAAYEQIRAEAEEELARAREEGRTNDIDYWQQQLDDANTSIQEARDKLVTSFEDNLNAIADAFDKAVERIVQTFGDAVYAFGGLEGLSEDYSFIRENTELMAQDYEKIYELSKLNRNINKTLNDNNIIAGKQKMIELQKEINDLQASGAELSKYDLEYLQAKYELRLAEIELENAQNAKETVRLSKDSEGNWSYVYTASTEKIDEAQQKYEDALYKMQNLSYEYIDEMSEKIISASQAMMEEIQNLNKNNFENEQEYLAEINRIKAKYAESLGVTEEELNKALANNEELYDKDWQSYSNKTGYAISESQNWIDRYAESTLGTLMKSTSDVADYMNNFSIALDELTNSIYRVAGDYYTNMDSAFAAAGITKDEFGQYVISNSKTITEASANTKKSIDTQTAALVDQYKIQADKVTGIQQTLDTAIDVYGPYIREIRDILRESAALTKELQNNDATYTYKQAADLFNSKYGSDYQIEMDAEGRWTKTVEGVKNEILQKHENANSDEQKRYFADMYTWLTSYILPYVTSLDTGGYTGEWGASGRLAMLHEKELILNANDTANFLDALNVSRELVNKVIEMNARASSFGIGGLSPSSIQDFAQTLEQQVVITAEFPNATDHNEIEEAFASLINTASQYANRN